VTKHATKIPSKRFRGRVFILGAGVSASCGIAVSNQILRDSVVRLEGTNGPAVDRIHRLLRYFYPNFDSALRNYPNIEDFLNLLEMAKRFNTEEFVASKLWSVEKLNEVNEVTLGAVRDYLWGRMAKQNKQRLIRDFVREYLHVGDTVITFNWDLTLERALEAYPGDPGFLYTYSRHRETKSFSLLKPHGSIDWFERKALKNLVSESELGKLDEQLCYYPRFNLSEHPKLAEISPVIVPPIAEKDFDDIKFLKRTWRHIFRAVTDATELHIIGYSLPKEDQFARLVFRRAIRNNIIHASRRKERPAKVIVVNPDPAAEGTFSRLAGRGVEKFEFRQAYFQDYVTGLDA
jgi:hypothetical protein